MAKKKNTINLDLGFETYEVRFQGLDDVTEISFNPADEDLPKRLFEAKEKITEKIKDIPDVTEDENGIMDTDSYVAAKNAVNKAVYEAVDYALGAPVSEKVFSHCSPLSIVADGQPFVLHFLEQIVPFVERSVKAKSEKSSAYIKSKYGKYLKK